MDINTWKLDDRLMQIAVKFSLLDPRVIIRSRIYNEGDEIQLSTLDLLQFCCKIAELRNGEEVIFAYGWNLYLLNLKEKTLKWQGIDNIHTVNNKPADHEKQLVEFAKLMPGFTIIEG